MILVFRLSTAVLQLCLTQWIDESWSWKSFFVPTEDYNDDWIPRLLVQTVFYSTHNLPVGEPSGRNDIGTVRWYGEPILARLVFSLVELAMGCTLQEIKTKEVKHLDKDGLDLLTAFKVPESGLIARAESQSYEDVVGVLEALVQGPMQC